MLFTRARFVLTSILAVGTFCAAAFAQPCGTTCKTMVPDEPAEGTWTLAGSPYCVNSDLRVTSLTIEPGVCVLVNGPYQIEVLVQLRVMGTVAQPVTITSKDPSGRWKGLLFGDLAVASELNYCTISRSDNSGVRIVMTGGVPPIFKHCTFTDNTSPVEGGGMRVSLPPSVPPGQELIIDQCTFSQNTANPTGAGGSSSGGGLRLSGPAIILGSLFDGNNCLAPVCCSALAGGSAIYCDGPGLVEIRNCIIRNGSTQAFDFSRGSIYYAGSGTLSLVNSIIACNTSAGIFAGASGVWVDSGMVNVTNCTITQNDLQGIGGDGGAVTVRNSILYFNNQTSPPPFPTYGSQYSGTVTFEYSDVQGAALPAGPGNKNVNPAFKGTGCDACQLGISCFSPLVDMGDPDPVYNDGDCCSKPPPCGTARNDMGAHGGPLACKWPVICAVDANHSCTLSISDFVSFQNAYALGCMETADVGGSTSCTPDGQLTIFDFACFQNGYALGCK